jgi:hypothetical protein
VNRHHLAFVIVVILLLLLVTPGVASAGRGQDCLVDDPSMIQISPEDQAEYDQEEAKFQQWLADRKALETEAETGSMEAAAALDSGSYSFCNTTSHRQSRNDYCGPATCAIIDHYLRGENHHGQNWWADYTYNGQHLWTDANGASMYVMSEGLQAVTGRGFAYTYGNSAAQVYSRTSYSLSEYHRCVSYGMRIYAAEMNYYRYYHDGHIVTGRGYDYRDTPHKILLDDSYPENEYQSGGGDTYGRKTYPKTQIGNAVVSSANQQMIY